MAMSNKTTYKTQGTIASASIEVNNTVTFTIEPVEPYDFPVKEKGETTKYILFQSISNEKKWLAVEHTTESTSGEPNGKVKVEVLLKLPKDATFKLDNSLTFSDLLQLQQNRTKVEIQIENYPEADEKDLPEVKVFPVSRIQTK